jgi:YHS domain-containing protein
VAYFTESRPVKGSTKFATDWMGATWQFSSQKHLDLFEAEPGKYAPQYGGYCAYGVAVDNLIKIEPDQWTITGGKLYLNYDRRVQRTWEKDISGFVETADRKFENLLTQ